MIITGAGHTSDLSTKLFGQPQSATRSHAPMRRPPSSGSRGFDAGVQDRLTADWSTMPVTADWLIRLFQRTLVARSRDLAANNDYLKNAIRRARINIAGPRGVMLQAVAKKRDGLTLDTDANNAIEAAWVKWGKKRNCDIRKKHSWRMLQSLAVQDLARDGEFMFQKVFGRQAGAFGFALRKLDPQRCNPQHDVYDMGNGNYIRAGIEFNDIGQRVAYHFAVIKDSDSFYNYTYAGVNYHRIAADEIIHGFIEEFPGQERGLPWGASGMLRLKHLGGFEEAAVVNARVGAQKLGFFQWRDGFSPPDDLDVDAAQYSVNSQPGEFDILPEGLELNPWNPQYPNNELAPFSKHMLRGVAAGFGQQYNALANDLEGVNFSSIRQGTLDEREYWKECQEMLVDDLCDAVYEAWLPVSLLSGQIKTRTGKTLPPERLDAYMDILWQPRRWTWIDPTSDVAAAEKMKNNMMAAPSQFIRESGNDPQAVWAQASEDIKQMRAAGIPEKFIESMFLGQNYAAATKQNETKPNE